MREVFARAKVGIAGAGGLGSNCAVSLARAGIGWLVIADFDKVSEQNLDRQYYFKAQVGDYKVEALAENLRRIEPEIKLSTNVVRLDPVSVRALFQDCDVIVEAFDDAEAKSMLLETALDAFPQAQIVAASGLAGIGHFESIRIIHKGNLHICGDFEHEVSPSSPPVAPRVAIVANIEADIVLDILLQGGCHDRSASHPRSRKTVGG